MKGRLKVEWWLQRGVFGDRNEGLGLGIVSRLGRIGWTSCRAYCNKSGWDGDWEGLLKREGLAWVRNGSEVHVFPEGVDADAIELVGGEAEARSWRIGSEETLRAVLARWSERAGVEVLWLTDRRYRLHEGRMFGGSFEEAVGALFFSLSHLPHAPVAELAGDGGVLSVMHRAAREGGER